MRYLTIAGLLALSLTALAGAGTAVAGTTDLTAGHATLSAGATLSGSLGGSGPTTTFSHTEGTTVLSTCSASTFHGSSETTTVFNGPVAVGLTELLFANCTRPVHTHSAGRLTITNIGNRNGTVNGDEQTFIITVAGVSCRYSTEMNTHLGILDGETSTVNHAVITVNATLNEEPLKAFLCPDTIRWVADYVVTSPTGLNVGS